MRRGVIKPADLQVLVRNLAESRVRPSRRDSQDRPGDGTCRVLILEAKRTRNIEACWPPETPGHSGYNSKLNGQLELNHCLAFALSQWRQELPARGDQPYAYARKDSIRSVKNASVLRHFVYRFGGIQFGDFKHIVITTDETNPFKKSDSERYLPALYTPDSLTESRWTPLKERFGWTSCLK
jgi:hypothetical protein